MNSMTGYGRACGRDRKHCIEVELRSVNHRFLTLKQSLPEGLARREREIERMVRARMSRGSLSLVVSIKAAGGSGPALPDLGVLRACYRRLEGARKALGMEGPLGMRDLLAVPTLWSPPSGSADSSGLWRRVKPLVERAMEALAASRAREGASIARDLSARLDSIEGLLRRIEARAPLCVESYQKRLDERIRTIMSKKGIDAAPVDVVKEIALYADRCDVSEEVQRLRAHAEEFRKVLRSKGQSGRRLEFIVQEMGREANTIASKGNDAEISSCAVEMKTQLEKIKEQVENVE